MSSLNAQPATTWGRSLALAISARVRDFSFATYSSREDRIDQQVRNKLKAEVCILLQDRGCRDNPLEGGIRLQMPARGFDGLGDIQR